MEPARTVYIDMTVPFGWAGRVAGRAPVPLWLRAAGFTYQPWQTGSQIAWARFATGAWAAVVEITLTTARGETLAPVTVWVPESAVRLHPVIG